jgi:Ca-activated chloride channel family protein
MLKPGEVSRVIVLTDGDANIGNTGHEAILKSIEGYVKEGVTLSAIGFGTGNYRDQMLEQLADKGNGNNFFIDSMTQARRVFEEQLGGLLEVVAKDVKFQVDFNPKSVKRYRLIGYENRDIADKDFRNDRVDSGDVGAGHAVTALFAVETVGDAHDLGTVRLREKAPNGEVAEEQAYPLAAAPWAATFGQAPRSFRLAATAALFADVLRGRPGSYAQLLGLADGLGADADAAELRDLIGRAEKEAHAVQVGALR